MWYEYEIEFSDGTTTLMWIDMEEDLMDQILEMVYKTEDLIADDVVGYRQTGKRTNEFEYLPDEESEEDDDE
jgi:hypothetical protein